MNDNMMPSASGSGGIKGLLPIIAIVLGLLNLAGLGYGVYAVQKFFKSMDEKQAIAEKEHGDEEENGDAEDGEDAEEEVPQGPILAIDPFVANLNEPGTSRYLRTTFELEMVDQEAIDAFNKNKSKTRNKVLTYLASLSVAETRGAKNLEKIQRDIIQKINEELGGEEKVRNLFFKDFVVQ